MAVTRPSSTRTEYERAEDVALTWIEEWLQDIFAGLEVMYQIIDGTDMSEKPRLGELEVAFTNLMNSVEKLIGRVKKL